MCLCHVRGKRCGWDKSCVCGRYADANPDESRIVTKKGFELHKEWDLEQFQRDQDMFRMYIFEDWSGYGVCEVMENMVRNRVICYIVTTTTDVHSSWPSIGRQSRRPRTFGPFGHS